MNQGIMFHITRISLILLSLFVPSSSIPDIDENQNLMRDTILTSPWDKIHCSPDDLKTQQCCVRDSVKSKEGGLMMSDSLAVVHNRGLGTNSVRLFQGGFGGMAQIGEDQSVAGFLKYAEEDEQGVRVYRIDPGKCSGPQSPYVTGFAGFYPLEEATGMVVDVASIPGKTSRVVVLEAVLKSPRQPEMNQNSADYKICMVDLQTSNLEDKVLLQKSCILEIVLTNTPDDTAEGRGQQLILEGQTRVGGLLIQNERCFVVSVDARYEFISTGNGRTNATLMGDSPREQLVKVCFTEAIFTNQN